MRVRALLVATVAGLVLVSGAAAGRAHRVKLALVPLPKSAIGPAARGLAPAPGSGVVSNAAAATSTPDGTAAELKKLGRLTGYVLEYGNAFTGAPGITGVHTGVERYRTAADARHGLAFWQKEDSKLGALGNPSFNVTNVLVHVPAVARKRFAYLTSYSASNIAPVSGLDEQVLDGRYILDVIVTGGTASAVQALAPTLAKKLDSRLRLALRGRLHGRPVKLPAKPKAGPPPGGRISRRSPSGPPTSPARRPSTRDTSSIPRRSPTTASSCSRRASSTRSTRRSSGIRRRTRRASSPTSRTPWRSRSRARRRST